MTDRKSLLMIVMSLSVFMQGGKADDNHSEVMTKELPIYQIEIQTIRQKLLMGDVEYISKRYQELEGRYILVYIRNAIDSLSRDQRERALLTALKSDALWVTPDLKNDPRKRRENEHYMGVGGLLIEINKLLYSKYNYYEIQDKKVREKAINQLQKMVTNGGVPRNLGTEQTE